VSKLDNIDDFIDEKVDEFLIKSNTELVEYAQGILKSYTDINEQTAYFIRGCINHYKIYDWLSEKQKYWLSFWMSKIELEAEGYSNSYYNKERDYDDEGYF
jgi:hypothetical protein